MPLCLKTSYLICTVTFYQLFPSSLFNSPVIGLARYETVWSTNQSRWRLWRGESLCSVFLLVMSILIKKKKSGLGLWLKHYFLVFNRRGSVDSVVELTACSYAGLWVVPTNTLLQAWFEGQQVPTAKSDAASLSGVTGSVCRDMSCAMPTNLEVTWWSLTVLFRLTDITVEACLQIGCGQCTIINYDQQQYQNQFY